MRPVAIVQHEKSVPPGHIETFFEDEGIPYVLVDAPAETSWPLVDDIGGLVVLGGTMNVDELDVYPFLMRSRNFMRDAIAVGVPTLGVCLGAQMMARVLGAEVHRAISRNALFSKLELTDEGQGDPIAAPFAGVEVLQFHEDTFALPQDAILLATSAASALPQAFRYGNYAYATQFHFEVDEPIVRGWIDDIGPRSLAEDWGCGDGGLELTRSERLDAQALVGKKLLGGFMELVRAPNQLEHFF